MIRYPLTDKQASSASPRLGACRRAAAGYRHFEMRVCYGDDSQAVIRADETAAALQRLKWELERTKVREQAAGSA